VPDREPTRLHRQLAAELGHLRSLSGLSGRAMAERTKSSQPTIVRIERAEAVPSMPVVRAWLEATDADPDLRERVIALTDAIHVQTVRWPTLLTGRTHLQDDVREREQESVIVRNFQPTVIAGLLQTPAYTRALMPLTDITGKIDHEATVAARLQRQQVLYDSGRTFQFLIGESVLRWSPGDDVMAGQLDRIAQLSELPTVEIAVLPVTAHVATPWHNFVVHILADDSAYVTTELIHGTQRLSDSEEVGLYRGLWDRLWSASVSGGDAVRQILAAAERVS
jgi:transcriptional regulator with XRE-family HTH domain